MGHHHMAWGSTMDSGWHCVFWAVSTDLSSPLLKTEGHNERKTEENMVDFEQSLWKFLSVPDLEGVETCHPQWKEYQNVTKAPKSLLIKCLLHSWGHNYWKAFPELVKRKGFGGSFIRDFVISYARTTYLPTEIFGLLRVELRAQG